MPRLITRTNQSGNADNLEDLVETDVWGDVCPSSHSVFGTRRDFSFNEREQEKYLADTQILADCSLKIWFLDKL